MENTMTGQVEKRSVEELAVFGGRPAFSEPLHVGRPNIGDRETFLSYVEDILDRRWLTNDGRYVQEFEHRVADLVGAKHCVTTCNATVALEIAIRAVGLSGEVAAVPIDSRLDVNKAGLRTPAEVESSIARMDVVLTTRLHGTALSLKNGVPVVAIDPSPTEGACEKAGACGKRARRMVASVPDKFVAALLRPDETERI
jgi:hypothetical protein